MTANQATAPIVNGNSVTFYHGSSAQAVSVAGDFNAWSPTSTPMTRRSNDLYEATVSIPIPADYRYKFIVDGTWISDPANSRREPDGYGGEHSIVSVACHSQATAILRGLEAVLKAAVPGSSFGVRHGILHSMDSLLMVPAAAKCPCLEGHFIRQIEHLLKRLERRRRRVDAGGVEIHHVYNAGYILRTPHMTIGLDVVTPRHVWDVNWKIPTSLTERLARACDVLLVTHRHGDHLDPDLVAAMRRHGKPVVGPAELIGAELPADAVAARPDEAIVVNGLDIKAHNAVHVYDKGRSLAHRVYEFDAMEGCHVIFMGDHDYTASLSVDRTPDVLFAKFGGVSPLVNDKDAWDRLIDSSRARAVIPIHLMEIGHPLGGGRIPYSSALHALQERRVVGDVLLWGECLAWKKEV